MEKNKRLNSFLLSECMKPLEETLSEMKQRIKEFVATLDEMDEKEFNAGIEYAKKGFVHKVPSRGVILNVWGLGNEWKELTGGRIDTEHGTQLEYIQKHWTEGDYYDKIKG